MLFELYPLASLSHQAKILCVSFTLDLFLFLYKDQTALVSFNNFFSSLMNIFLLRIVLPIKNYLSHLAMAMVIEGEVIHLQYIKAHH